MKHRFFLLILAAFMATSAWAQAMWPERAVDTIPVPVYITDIQFNPSTNQLSFVDNFQNDFARVRMYNISLEYRTENSHIWQMALGNPTHFIYTEYVSPSQSTSNPNVSPTNLSGTIVRPPLPSAT